MAYDPLVTFDARSAYAGDYRFAPGVVRAVRTRPNVSGSQTFWIRQITLTHPDYPAAAEMLGLQSTEEAWEAWKDRLDDDNLRPNDVLEIDERPATRNLIVGRTGLSQYSRWMFSSTREKRDG